METAPFTFSVELEAQVSDHELTSLLHQVYVEGGFTPASVAAEMFAAPNVRARGILIAAREQATRALLGSIVLVPPDRPARVIAHEREGELHLLAVMPQARRAGVGSALVRAALRHADALGWPRLALYTQARMHCAQRIYASLGFRRDPQRDFQRGERPFLAYARDGSS
jgi:ribosomal protein S18 acetylase RimI-like enzyme